MTNVQRVYKALRKTTILSKSECRKAAIKITSKPIEYADTSKVTEYGLTQNLSFSIRVF